MKHYRQSQFPRWCYKCSKNINDKYMKRYHKKRCDGLEALKTVESAKTDLLFSYGYLKLNMIENDFKLGTLKLDKIDNVFKVIQIKK